jgi:exopolyphosphatase / guanosine-5'-triphosphate,3'-diphosphate pyrophosphatase
MTAEPATRMASMRVAVIDVGSNTARLLVADVGDGVEAVREEKAFLGLAADIVRHGEIRRRKLELAASVSGRYVRIAERLGVDAVETIVTAPGRQGRSGHALVRQLERAGGAPVRVLSADEEGRLAFAGAVSRAGDVPGVVAVCDVGGGSTELAVGTSQLGAAWVRSADIGSLRLTRSSLAGDPPTAVEIAAAREEARAALAGFVPPGADVAFAVGGSARAAAKLVGRRLGAEDLDVVVELAARRSSAKLARLFGLDPARAETLLAGALVLGEASRRLGLPFTLGRGGLREGAALALAARVAAGAAAA